MSSLREVTQQALEALKQITVLAEYGTTGPGKCKSNALSSAQATSLRLSISNIARAALAQQDGCPRCRSPLFAGTQCSACGRAVPLYAKFEEDNK